MNESGTKRELADKKALVTGGSRGIGRAVCLELARRGADVAFIYHSRDIEAEATAAEIRALGRVALALKTDLADARGVGVAVDRAAAEFGRLDSCWCRRPAPWGTGTRRPSFPPRIGTATWRSICRGRSTSFVRRCRTCARPAEARSWRSRRSPRRCVRRATCKAPPPRPDWRRWCASSRARRGGAAFAPMPWPSASPTPTWRGPHSPEWGEEIDRARRPRHSAPPHRHAGGGGARGLLSRRARRRLHHRQGAAGRWRPDHRGVNGMAVGEPDHGVCRAARRSSWRLQRV